MLPIGSKSTISASPKELKPASFSSFPTFSIFPASSTFMREYPIGIFNGTLARIEQYTPFAVCSSTQSPLEIRQPACVLLRCLVVNAQIVFAARYRHRKRTDRLTVSQKTVKRLVLHILRQIHIPVIAADRMRTDISHLSQCRTRYRSRLLRHCPPGYSAENSGTGSTVPSLC